MSNPPEIQFNAVDLDALGTAEGRVAIFVGADGKLDPSARRVNKLTKGAVARLVESEAFEAAKNASVTTLAWPVGMAAEAVDVVRLERRPSVEDARKAGGALAKRRGTAGVLIAAGSLTQTAELSLGFALRDYSFTARKTKEETPAGPVIITCTKPEEVAAQAAPLAAVAEGVYFTRDLVNEPANILTTDDFAARLAAMQDLGLDVEILEEAELEKLGMRLLPVSYTHLTLPTTSRV